MEPTKKGNTKSQDYRALPQPPPGMQFCHLQVPPQMVFAAFKLQCSKNTCGLMLPSTVQTGYVMMEQLMLTQLPCVSVLLQGNPQDHQLCCSQDY